MTRMAYLMPDGMKRSEIDYVHENHHRRKLPTPRIDPVPLYPRRPQDDIGREGHEKLKDADNDEILREIQPKEVHPRHKQDGKNYRPRRHRQPLQEGLPGNAAPHVKGRFLIGKKSNDDGGQDILRRKEKIGIIRCQWLILSGNLFIRQGFIIIGLKVSVRLLPDVPGDFDEIAVGIPKVNTLHRPPGAMAVHNIRNHRRPLCKKL